MWQGDLKIKIKVGIAALYMYLFQRYRIIYVNDLPNMEKMSTFEYNFTEKILKSYKNGFCLNITKKKIGKDCINKVFS